MRYVHINEAAERKYLASVRRGDTKKQISRYHKKWRRIHRATMKRANKNILGMRRIEAANRLRIRWAKKQTRRMVRERDFEMKMRPQRIREYKNQQEYLKFMKKIHDGVKTPVKM